ncbi:class I SAM-dependent rRNA methyltransferase [Novispirillum sp. DQ9]|uniref:class I SAM-dependent rRNA methyltransferase n=1 Tax=Novispirillum sp. DQ9 TaxID=3398612 RepID=UPI003C7DC4E1
MEAVPALPVVHVQKGRSGRARRGHPWLFSNEIDMTPQTKALPAGALVVVQDAGGERLGVGTFNAHSLIAVRLLARDPATVIDTAFLAARLRAALALREALFPTPHYRLVHSEADGLPGLIIDRYGDVVTVQANTAGMDALLPQILDALEEVLAPRAIVLRNDSPVRGLEGLEQGHSVARGTLEGPVELVENGVRFLADLTGGQKTGWFYDQRPNRAFVAALAKGRSVIDVFSYAGGFGLTCLAGGASSALLVDRASDPLDLATRAAALNGFADRLETRAGDGFKTLEALGRDGARFGVVVADPPAFVKSKKDLAAGAKGYRKMARLAAAVVEPGGFLLCGSCSHHMSSELFHEEVTRGIGLAGRTGRILYAHGAGADHPVHPALPESAYLKVLVMQLD